MTRTHSHQISSLAAAVLFATITIAGCHGNAHPDDKQSVYAALAQNDLRSITVSQDRGSGVITLNGIVGSADQKAHAVTIAQQAAPGYTITNKIQVESAGLEGMEKVAQANAALDSAIEDKFKATLQTDRKLHREHIQYSAEKGTLYLKGSVRTEKEKQEAEDLAHKVPEVQRVVNDIAVKPS